MVISGVAGPSVNGGTGSGAPTWPVLPLGGALRAGQSTLDLSALDHGCIRYVATEYAPSSIGNSSGGASFPVPFRTLNVSPPQSFVSLGSLPGGDWTLRVVAYFSTGQVGQEDASVIERFFRVITSPSDDPVPIPTPISPPVVACAPLPRDGGPPSLVLAGSAAGPIVGATGASSPSLVPVQIGDRIELQVRGDACALAWDFTTAPDSNAEFTHSDGEPNPGNDPFLFAQNRWLLQDLPTGQVTVTATVRFSADISTTARWRLDVHGRDVPAVRITAPDGGSVVAARAPCGAAWIAVDATSGYEICAVGPPAGHDPVPDSRRRIVDPDRGAGLDDHELGRIVRPAGSVQPDLALRHPGWLRPRWLVCRRRPEGAPERAHAGGLPQSRRDAAVPDIRPGPTRDRGRDDDGLCRDRAGRMTRYSLDGSHARRSRVSGFRLAGSERASCYTPGSRVGV